MKNKKSLWIGGVLVALVIMVLAGVGVSSVYAQSPTTTLAHGRGPGGGLSLAGLQIAAQKLGMTTDELITALQGGKTLEQIAQEKGIDYTSIQTAIQQQSQADLRTRIQQAVTDGTITQAKGDWLLEGLDKGYIGNGPDGDGFLGGMHGFGLGPNKGPQTQPITPAQPSQPTQAAPTQQGS